jgi:hypothetical protein
LISGEKITAGLYQKRRLERCHVIHASFMDGEQIIPPFDAKSDPSAAE